MKFFLPPYAKDDLDTEKVERGYSSLRGHVGEMMGAVLSDRRIRILHYRHDGKAYSATVGEPDPYERQEVLAIFYEPLRVLFHVVTYGRGVRGSPTILVGKDEVTSSEDFE